MKLSTNIALWVVVAIATIATEELVANPGRLVEAMGSSFEGKVLSVDEPSKDSKAVAGRQATVRLRSGEVVRATVGGCLVFPGQTARLSKYGRGPGAVYIVTANGTNDS
jgi:hypothetical protein